MSGIQYPVSIQDIGKFENQNNISVNVYVSLRIGERLEQTNIDPI